MNRAAKQQNELHPLNLPSLTASLLSGILYTQRESHLTSNILLSFLGLFGASSMQPTNNINIRIKVSVPTVSSPNFSGQLKYDVATVANGNRVLKKAPSKLIVDAPEPSQTKTSHAMPVFADHANNGSTQTWRLRKAFLYASV